MPAISTPSATCWPRTFASTSSTGFASRAAATWADTFAATRRQPTGTAFPDWWTVDRRSSYSIPTIPQDRRHTSFFLNGRTTAWPRFEISCSRATPSKVRTLSLWAHPSANLKGSEDRERRRGDPCDRPVADRRGAQTGRPQGSPLQQAMLADAAWTAQDQRSYSAG